MDSTIGSLTLWGIAVVVGVATFAMRLSFIGAAERLTFPGWLQQALPYVPSAAITALLVPDLINPAAPFALSPQLLAGAVAAVVAWYTRHTLLTIAAGMGSLWLLLWLGVGA